MSPIPNKNRDEEKEMNQGRERPALEKQHEGSFSYEGEDTQKTEYTREARFAGRDADATGRYDIESQVLKSRGTMESEKQRSYQIKVERKIDVNKPREELYRYWRNLGNLPNFLDHVKTVKVIDDKKSHWIMEAPLGKQIEWDAEIVTDTQNQVLSWRSLEGTGFENAGSVRFQDKPQGTEVKVELAYNPPGGRIGEYLAQVFGEEPSHEIEKGLEHFKYLMEHGGA